MKKLLFLLFCCLPLTQALAQDIKLTSLKSTLANKSYIFKNLTSRTTFEAAKGVGIVSLSENTQHNLTSVLFTVLFEAPEKKLKPTLEDVRFTFNQIAANKTAINYWLDRCITREKPLIKFSDDNYYYKCFITGESTVFMAYK